MITAVDTSVLIAITEGEAEAYRWTDLLTAARAAGDLVICDVVAAEFFALLLDERRFQQSLNGLGIVLAGAPQLGTRTGLTMAIPRCSKSLMQAWRVHGFGEPRDVFRLEDVPEPSAADLAGMGMALCGWVPLAPGAQPFTDWVIMRMSAAALGLPDVTMCRGTYPVPVGRPYISGQEGVGVVIGAAPGRTALLGRRVVAVTVQPFGSLAPVAVGVSPIFAAPDGLTDEEAAGFLIPAHTAYHVVHRRGWLQKGETVAVLGAAGGLGSAAVQLCVAAGSRVIAIAGGEDKVEFCRRLGAHVAVDHQQCDFVQAVKVATGGRGVDMIVDPVQGDMGAHARALLAPNGRHVLCGHAGGLKPIDPHFYMYNHTLVGATLGSYPHDEMQRIHQESQDALAKLLAEGRFRPAISRSVAFADVPDALSDLAARRTMGRVTVRI